MTCLYVVIKVKASSFLSFAKEGLQIRPLRKATFNIFDTEDTEKAAEFVGLLRKYEQDLLAAGKR